MSIGFPGTLSETESIETRILDPGMEKKYGGPRTEDCGPERVESGCEPSNMDPWAWTPGPSNQDRRTRTKDGQSKP